MAEEILLRERKGNVGTLILNRPDKLNSMSVELLLELIKAVNECAADDTIRCLVITGAGDKAFCAGFDIKSIPTNFSAKDAQSLEAKAIRANMPIEQLMNSLKNYPYPTIAMLNGLTIGAGFNLAMCCDIRIAADTVLMGIPPAKLGLVYFPGGIKQVAEALGMARAREVFFTGRIYGPEEVRRMGLAHQMVPAAELSNTTYRLAEEISENAPLSLKGIKKILNMLEAQTALTETGQKEAELLMAQAFMSEDLKEGQLAFLQRRKPQFKGR